jgi:hypothetical protein
MIYKILIIIGLAALLISLLPNELSHDQKNQMVIDGKAEWIFNGDNVIFRLK